MLADYIKRKEKEQGLTGHAATLQYYDEIDSVIKYVEDNAGVNVYFDDSRAWALYSTEKPEAESTPGYCAKYGAYRDYLGGGIRGSIQCNLTGDLYDLFKSALNRIEEILNGKTEGSPSWDQATGVLL